MTGANGADVRAALAGLAVRFVENPSFAEGMSTSLAAGIASLAPGTEAALIVLGDQPLVPAEAYAAVLAEYRARAPADRGAELQWSARASRCSSMRRSSRSCSRRAATAARAA